MWNNVEGFSFYTFMFNDRQFILVWFTDYLITQLFIAVNLEWTVCLWTFFGLHPQQPQLSVLC